MASHLFGQYHVTPTPTAMKEALALFPRFGDLQELRRHALKLAYWPRGSAEAGVVGDLDWETIVGMSGPKAHELRIDDVVGGLNNLRIVFYVHEPVFVRPGDVLPRLWTIGVMQKKTARFSTFDLRTFAARVAVVRARQYPS